LTFVSVEASDPGPNQGAESATTTAAAPMEPTGSEHTGPASDPPGGADLSGSLERLLPRVEEGLRSVQVQMDNLQRRVDEGAPAPASSLIRLRSSLERLAPMLLALDAQLATASRLSPRLRALLRRVRAHLVGTSASAAGLIAVLRRSGLRGHEVRLLLRELEGLRTFQLALVSNPGVAQAPAQSPAGPYAAQPYGVEPAPAAAPLSAAAAPHEPRAEGRPATESRDLGAGPTEPPPWSSAPGSASASPGGAFFAAGMASLATLFLYLVLPRLWSCLEQPKRRRYAVVFLAPLERPG
jgi:hypothetical protein